MAVIAPIIFHAFPPDASNDQGEPALECFNAGASAEGVAALSTPFKESRVVWGTVALIVAGLAPAAAATMIFVFLVFTHHEDPVGVVTDWIGPFVVPSAVLFVAGILGALFVSTSLNPKVRAWKKALDAAWAAHGADITELEKLGHQTRKDVLVYGATLEKVRRSLNRLNPEGDELDLARYRLQRFIDASDLPLLGKRAADAAHIKDPKVRQAAREYKALVEQQKLARRALDDAVAEAETLLADRRQARTDAEIIRLVHER